MADESKALYEQVMLLIRSVRPAFGRDGDMYFFLVGGNLQEGVAGFGKSGWEAALNFYKDFFGENSGANKEGFTC